jgi:hypothetical protein
MAMVLHRMTVLHRLALVLCGEGTGTSKGEHPADRNRQNRQ